MSYHPTIVAVNFSPEGSNIHRTRPVPIAMTKHKSQKLNAHNKPYNNFVCVCVSVTGVNGHHSRRRPTSILTQYLQGHTRIHSTTLEIPWLDGACCWPSIVCQTSSGDGRKKRTQTTNQPTVPILMCAPPHSTIYVCLQMIGRFLLCEYVFDWHIWRIRMFAAKLKTNNAKRRLHDGRLKYGDLLRDGRYINL